MTPTGDSTKRRRAWSRCELLLAFRLYCNTPFGKLHRSNPDIVALAHLLDRTPSAVAMKAVNFASLDPVLRARGIAGLGNASEQDKRLWQQFSDNPEEVAAAAEDAYEALARRDFDNLETQQSIPDGPTETTRPVRVRRVQAFFRSAVLVSYENRCALSDIAIPELLTACHIIPWNVSMKRRADPTNGIALNALYDRAFDRGLITFDENFRTVLSSRLRDGNAGAFQKRVFASMEGRPLRLPVRFAPDPEALRYHRENVFRS